MVFLLSTVAVVDQATSAATPGNAKPIQMTRRRLPFRVGVRSMRYRVNYDHGATCGGGTKVTVLVPPPQEQEQMAAERNIPVDKTIAEHPTFFVYLPAELATRPAHFTLQTEVQIKELYNIKFTLTGKSGIVGISLPSSAPALQIGQKYLWQMAIQCNPRDRSDDIMVNGWVERVQPPTAATGDQLKALAEAGIWQDTVATLALRRYEQPSDRTAAEDWANLMEDVGLSQFKDTEIVQIVKN
jgi:Domain of Unknown Function (DUF928)